MIDGVAAADSVQFGVEAVGRLTGLKRNLFCELALAMGGHDAWQAPGQERKLQRPFR